MLRSSFDLTCKNLKSKSLLGNLDQTFVSHAHARLASHGQIQNRIRLEPNPRRNVRQMHIFADELTRQHTVDFGNPQHTLVLTRNVKALWQIGILPELLRRHAHLRDGIRRVDRPQQPALCIGP